jgi:hypothetical protein
MLLLAPRLLMLLERFDSGDDHKGHPLLASALILYLLAA